VSQLTVKNGSSTVDMHQMRSRESDSLLFAEGVKPVEIIRRVQAQYSDNCLLRSKIYEWTDHFKKGRTSVCDEERSGRPSTSRTENNIEAVERTNNVGKQTNNSGRH
jgi:hypothetical protein